MRSLLPAGIALMAVLSGAALTAAVAVPWFWTATIGTVSIVALSAAIVVHTRVRGDAFSLLNVTGIFYLLTFGVGGLYFGFYEVRGGTAFDRSALDKAILAGFGAWFLLAAGYILTPLRKFEHLVPVIRPRPAASPIAVAAILLGIGWLARLQAIEIGRYFHVPASGEIVSTGSSWLITAAAVLPTLGTAYVGARSYSGGRGRRLRFTYYLLFAVEVLWAIPTGSRASVLTLLVMATVIRYYGTSRRLPVRSILVGASVAVFLVLPFGLEYRGDNRHFQSAPRRSLESAAAALASRSPSETLEAGFESTASRFSGVLSVAAILSEERSLTNHTPGATYWWIVEAAVPRAVHTEKADPGLFGNEFGRAYGIIGPSDRITGITVTHPGELYLSFGLLGILFGMPLIGALYRLIDSLLNQRDHPAILAVFAIIVWEFLNGSESIVAVGVIGVLKLAAFCALALFVAIRLVEMSRAKSTIRLTAPTPEAGTL